MDNYAFENDANNGKPYTIPTSSNDRPSNYLVEVNTRKTLFKKPKFYRRLSILCFLLVILLIIVIIVLTISFDKERRVGRICTSNECIRSAANLKLSLNQEVNPCDDFYEFTCGHWSTEHPNHGWYPKFSTFDEIDERLSIRTMEFLEKEPEEHEPLPVQQCRDLYKSCKDVESIDELGYSAMQKYLKEAGLPTVPSLFTLDEADRTTFTFDWLKTETKLKKTFAMDVFVGFAVDSDIYNMTRNVMYIGTVGHKCPLPSPFMKRRPYRFLAHEDHKTANSDSSYRQTIRNSITKYILEVVIKNATSEEPNAQLIADAVSQISSLSDQLDILNENYSSGDYLGTPRTLKYLQLKTDEYLKNGSTTSKTYPDIWRKYLNYIFEDTNVTLDMNGEDRLYIDEIEEPYLYEITRILLNTPEVYIELYMWWITVLAMILNTSSEVAEYITAQTAPLYGNSATMRSRSLDCSGLVTSFMGMALSYGIVDQTFNNRTKPKVEQMINDIKGAFVERVHSLNWMDLKTKDATLEKTKEMLSFIGYPTWLFQNGSLEHYYEGVEMKNDTYLDNMMTMVMTYIPSRLNSLRSKNERNWRTEPLTVNAYNSFTDNAIYVPMGILTYPVYNLGLEVLNYGAIGSILGHEITHGFDNSGRKYDKFGNYIQWWTNQTVETFENKTECFINQYNNYTIEGFHVQGKKTLGENLADNGGLNHAFKAYQNHVKKFGSEPHLPGFENYTNYQLFFISFGSVWCESSDADNIESQIEYDEHAPNSVRVMGSLHNSQEFARVFNCPVGSKMNPGSPKCRIW